MAVAGIGRGSRQEPRCIHRRQRRRPVQWKERPYRSSPVRSESRNRRTGPGRNRPRQPRLSRRRGRTPVFPARGDPGPRCTQRRCRAGRASSRGRAAIARGKAGTGGDALDEPVMVGVAAAGITGCGGTQTPRGKGNSGHFLRGPSLAKPRPRPVRDDDLGGRNGGAVPQPVDTS
jgi:hypothetical protein